MKIIGVDVGTHQVKAVEVVTGARGLHISAYHTLNLKPGGAQDVDLGVIEFLRTLVSKQDLGQTRFVLGIRQDKVAVRHKTFPFVEKNKIAKALPLELEDELPFPIENAVVDFKMVRYRGSEAEILACATPRSNVEYLISFFKDTGAELDIVSPEGVAFANLFENVDLPVPHEEPAPFVDDVTGIKLNRQVDVLLHMGHTRTLVLALEGQRLVAVRSLSWGSKSIVDALAIKYQLPFTEAQKEMEAKAFILNPKQQAGFEAKVFSDTISGAVREMVRDLQLTLVEIRSELRCEIRTLQTSGGPSQIQGLNAFLSQILEVPTNRVRLWERFKSVGFEHNEALEGKLSVALGLALEGLKKPRNPALNFLRGEFSNRPSQWDVFWETWGSTIKWASAAVVALMIWSPIRAMLASDLDVASSEALRTQAKQVALLNNRNANERGVTNYIKEKRKVAREMKNVAQVMRLTTAFDVLKRVSELAPAREQIKLDVRRFHVRNQQVRIEGFARSPAEVNLFQQSLKSLATDGKVNPVAQTIRGPQGQTVFAFTFNVDRGLGQE